MPPRRCAAVFVERKGDTVSLNPYEWAMLAVALMVLILPLLEVDFGKVFSKVLAKLRSSSSGKTDVQVDVREQEGCGQPDLYGLYRAFRMLRDGVSGDERAEEALDRIVLPAIATGVSDPHYGVAWDGSAAGCNCAAGQQKEDPRKEACKP